MYAYPLVIPFKKILYVLLVLNLLIGAFVLYGIFALDNTRMSDILAAVIGISIGIFYQVLLITLISYVEYLDIRMARMQDKLIRLEEGSPAKPSTASRAGSSPARSSGSMSDRLGKL